MNKQTKQIDKLSAFWPNEQLNLWQAMCHDNPILDSQNHESGHCTCKCTPIPLESLQRYTVKKRGPKPSLGLDIGGI